MTKLEIIPACVRKFPEGNLILLFPCESRWDNVTKQTFIDSYMFVGQHSEASKDLVKELENPTMRERKELIKHYEYKYDCKIRLMRKYL